VNGAAEPGVVYLAGAGPGDPGLLTLRVLRLLETADVILPDDLVSEEILALAHAGAEITPVGKRCGQPRITQAEIHVLMLDAARAGRSVLRLKSGDPLIFGRAGEELESLRKANVDVEIIPGVTSALASAAALGVSLTHRGKASAVTFLTSHQATPSAMDWQPYVASGATLTIYMPGSDYEQTAGQLISAGLGGATACAIVSRASSQDEQIYRTTVADLPKAPRLPAPTLLLVGEAVRAADVGEATSPPDESRIHPDVLPSLPTELDVYMDDQVIWGD